MQDIDILSRLHPVQACYIGMEYVQYFKRNGMSPPPLDYNGTISRYGQYQMYAQDREGNILFFDKSTEEQFIMEPSEVVSSELLIQEFDATQAFLIGMLAGFNKINKHSKSVFSKNKKHLRIVK